MDLPRILVFDMDGVLADVSRSYRATILAAAEMYLRDILGADVSPGYFEPAHTDALKRAGGFNNDWDATAGLVMAALSREDVVGTPPLMLGASATDALAAVSGSLAGRSLSVIEITKFDRLCALTSAQGGGLSGLLKATDGRNAGLVLHGGTLYDSDVITRLFQEIYLGGVAFTRIYGVAPLFVEGDGLAEQEPMLVPAALLRTLALDRRLGVATGRPRHEAAFFLERHGIADLFKVVLTEDDIAEAEFAEEQAGNTRPSWRKPDPWSVLRALEALGVGPAAYLGDTPDDIRAAKAANTVRQVWAVGCLWGAHDAAETRRAMEAVTPDKLLEGPEDLAAWLGLTRWSE